MRCKAILTAALVAVLATAWPVDSARAGVCDLPDGVLWIDYAEGLVTFRNEVFGRPGVIAAASGTAGPRRLRELGARTVYWHMNIRNIVGTPSAPADPLAVGQAANALFDRAVTSSACATPLIALEELWGSYLRTPWTASNAQYRANVLLLMRGLQARGARPFLWVHSAPYVGGDAAQWWRDAAAAGDIVYEAYYNAARINALGALLGNRRLRLGMRSVVRTFAAIGVPRSRLGLALGFHSAPGTLGREGLQPLGAWLDFVKWNALAARQIAAEEGISSVWSWGWAAFTHAGVDPDKRVAACVYLWTRDPALCDAPAAAAGALDEDRAEGQILLPAGVYCAFSGGSIGAGALGRAERLTRDRGVAATALLERFANRRVRVPARVVLRAERRIVALRFAGSQRRYRRALQRSGLDLTSARAVIADQLRTRRLSRSARLRRQGKVLGTAVCVRDDLPRPGSVDLSRYVRFLRVD
jgi:hypothetical protein